MFFANGKLIFFFFFNNLPELKQLSFTEQS